MEDKPSSTEHLSFTDNHHRVEIATNYKLGKERLPDLCPLNCDHKSCFFISEKTKDMNESSDSLSFDDCQPQAGKTSLWETLATIYFPMLLESIWGGVFVIRSLIITYVFQALLKTDTWSDSTLYRNLALLSPGDGKVPSWPPPAFVFLALFTATVLIIHPDGFTWIALRNIRQSLLYFFESSTTCWAWMIHDFGSVISTILAIATFAGLFFFCYLLHRTLRPRSKPEALNASSPAPEKSSRRKRRKGRGEKGRSSKQQQQSSSRSSSPVKENVASPPATITLDQDSKNSDFQTSTEKTVFLPPEPSEQQSTLPVFHEHETTTTHVADDTPNPPRLRVESLSTVDTTIDNSFEDVSVESSSGGSTPAAQEARIPRSNRAHSRKSRGQHGARNTTTPRNRKQDSHEKALHPKKNARTASTQVVPSRWDALKPMEGGQRMDTSFPNASKAGRKTTKSNPVRPNRSGRYQTSNQSNKLNTARSVAETNDYVAFNQHASKNGSESTNPDTMQTTLLPPRMTFIPTNESLWSNDCEIRNPAHPSLMTGFSLQTKAHSAEQSGLTLNPHSPVFSPSAAPLGVLRPPPGLTRPDSVMEPLHLSPPPGLPVPGLTLPCGSTSPTFMRPRDNPFVDDEEELIAAELQELGGQMAGSILDF